MEKLDDSLVFRVDAYIDSGYSVAVLIDEVWVTAK
jgi:hypothetical protein